MKGINKLINYIQKSINFVTVLIILGILVSNIIIMGYFNSSYELVSYKLNNIFFLIIPLIILILILYFLCSKFNIRTKKILIFVLIFQSIFSFVWINISKTIPVFDQGNVSDIAKMLLNNDSNLYLNDYIVKSPHQIGIVAYIQLIYSIFGQIFIAVQYLNVVWTLLITIMLYKITNIIFENGKLNKLVILLSGLFIQFIFLSTFVYGDIIGLSLSLASIYFLITFTKKNKKYSIFVSSILIGFACLVRNNYYIFLIAEIIYLLIYACKEKKLIYLFTIIFIMTIGILPSTVTKIYYENKYSLELNNGVPAVLYLIMGSEYGDKAPGWFNGSTYNTYDKYNSDTKEINQEQWNVYFNNLKNLFTKPKSFIVFYGKKFLSMWVETSNQSLFTNYAFYNSDYLNMSEEEKYVENNKFLYKIYFGNINSLLNYYFKALAIIIYFGVITYLIINRKNINTETTFLILIFLGGFIFHMLWEAKSRYIIPYIVVLLPIATNILIIIDRLKDKLKNMKRRKLNETNS